MDKEDVGGVCVCVCVCNGILLSHEKEGNPAICNNMGIILREISQTEEDKYCVILYVESKKAEPIETESRMVVTRGWRVRDMGRCWSKGTHFQLQDE